MNFLIHINERFNESLLIVNKIFEENFLLFEQGREYDEQVVFLVEDGHFQGAGYISKSDIKYGIEEIKECIQYEKLNPEADLIIRNYLWTNSKIKLKYF